MLFNNIFNINDITNKIKKGTFIEIVYYHYIYINNSKFNYNFIDTYINIKNFVDSNIVNSIIEQKGYGLMEDTRRLITDFPETYSGMLE